MGATALPVIHRPLVGPLNVFMPYGGDETRRWLRDVTESPRLKARWEFQSPAHWVVGRDHLAAIAFGLAERFGSVDLEMDYRHVEKCGTKCQHATSMDCTCACLGTTHGGPTRLNFLPIENTRTMEGSRVQVLRRLHAA